MIRFRFQNYPRCFIYVLLLMASITVDAQPLNFIHIQTENGQPYEVIWNGKNYPSSAKGYLVIPQVTTGKHELTIGFSDEKGASADYTFMVEIEDKPRGFSLRQAIDNSWALFDMVDLTLLKGAVVVPVVKTAIPDKTPGPISASAKEEGPAVKKEPLVVKEKASIKPTAILKIFDKSSNSGIDQVYVLTNGTRLDTIALFIPVIAEKSESNSGSNPSAFILRLEPSYIDRAKTILTRPRYSK